MLVRNSISQWKSIPVFKTDHGLYPFNLGFICIFAQEKMENDHQMNRSL